MLFIMCTVMCCIAVCGGSLHCLLCAFDIVTVTFYCNLVTGYRLQIVCLCKDVIKCQCRRYTNHLSPPLAASASCPSSTTGVRSGIGRETALTKMTEDNPARLRRAGVAACHSPCAGGHPL